MYERIAYWGLVGNKGLCHIAIIQALYFRSPYEARVRTVLLHYPHENPRPSIVEPALEAVNLKLFTLSPET